MNYHLCVYVSKKLQIRILVKHAQRLAGQFYALNKVCMSKKNLLLGHGVTNTCILSGSLDHDAQVKKEVKENSDW